jgi:hypothetical protein
VIVAADTVTGAVPVDVRVMDWAVVVFTVTLPKVRVDALKVSCGLAWGFKVADPVPLKLTNVVAPLAESLLTVICPLTAPADTGLNWTCKVTDCDGFSVAGKLPPTSVNPAPVMAAELIVSGDVPVDVSTNDCVDELFTVTLPKLKLVALAVSCEAVAWDAPLPCIDTWASGCADAPINETCPE